ncbi:tetratricopeptide repeat protein [Aliikangiella marina]|uniref:Tetratricopeptide repeat protein n=1 Tax=Aliikangiella marina TaxID=1712262 RepID=A0A545TI83_9GAMM|nr:tetratricopeptide repeat protein [Aliikangiella marina]TQV76939.1 tetratricopeptide repeat protein [Aliikangiella marina]
MAMKFDSFLKAFGLILGCFILSSCGTNPAKKTIGLLHTDNKPAELRSTVQFIPQRTKDAETGLLVPYVAELNPYTTQSSRIDVDSVKNFIAAKNAVQNGNLKQAKLLLNKITLNDAELSGPWVVLGDIARQQNDSETAIASYKKAIEINLDNVNAYIRLAILQRELGQFIDSQNTYSWALSRWKDFPEAHLNLAVLYDIYLNKPLKAQRHMEAYLFLTEGKNKRHTKWLEEIQSRTGEAINLPVEKRQASTLAASNP